MRSLRKRLKRAVLATLPAAALVCGCGGTHTVPESCRPAQTGAAYAVDGGCGACDPLDTLCTSTMTGGTCQRICNDCGCSNVAVVDPNPGLAGPGTAITGDWCTQRCGAAPTPGATLSGCHLEYRADGTAVPAGDGGAMMACTWELDGGACAPGADPCARCDPATELCFAGTGTCVAQAGGFCTGPTSSNLISGAVAPGDGGALDPATCAQLCERPSGASGDPLSCHLELAPNASPLQCEGQQVVACTWPHQGMCTGRRPEGFAPARPGPDLGSHFASMAQLEAASIPAFRRLERELAGLGAPVALRERVRRAARDEVRHARAMGRLARQHGARVPKVALERPSTRSRAEIALENAVEGCVRETFGAALALWQAEQARDPEVRGAMAAIADDEAAHAELAWDVAAWLERGCTAKERARIEAARAQAWRALAGELVGEPASQLAEPLGLPGQSQAQQLLARVQAAAEPGATLA